MRKQRSRWNMAAVLVLMIVCIMAMTVLLIRQYSDWRGHGQVVQKSNTFTESSRKLENPGRGFYHMHGFGISEEATDYSREIEERFGRDDATKLTLIQINLQNYRDGAITEQGLANVEALFEALESVDKQLIVRFLYDWHGENEQYEPESLDVILTHIQQLEPVLRKYSHRIFVIQGLFIGNWGEMNGTQYLGTEDLQYLARQLAAVTEESTFLAVRMPAQWRKITRIANPEEVTGWNSSLEARLGLYNDGMLGSWSDYGTYGNQTREEHGDFTYWSREEELAFQEKLCSYVPNGGEVIVDNSYNDFENAVADMKRMHITYLNRDYDTKVLDKWANTVVEEEGCFGGMDGLTYMERHLGYRLVLKEAALSYDFWKDNLIVETDVQNVGFAPIYRETAVKMVLYNKEDGNSVSYEVEQDIRSLPGGTKAEQVLKLKGMFGLEGLKPGKYIVYLEVQDVLSGERILFGNEQNPEEYGYRLGEVELMSEDTFTEALEGAVKAYLSETWEWETNK